MISDFRIITDEFDTELTAMRQLVGTFDVPGQSKAKVRIASANSSTLLLAAMFEEFVREMARAYAKAVVSSTQSINTVPKELLNTAWNRTMKSLASFDVSNKQPVFTKRNEVADPRVQFNVIYEFCTGDLSQNIYDDLIYNEHSMRVGQINSLFKICDLDNVCSRISNNSSLMVYFDESEPNKVHGLLVEGIEDFIRRRNRIAHCLNADTSSGPPMIFRDIGMFEAFANSICETLESEITQLS